MISIIDLTKEYKKKNNKRKALDNINLTLPNQGLVFITGSSGSGKTTLLNLIGALDKPTQGKILINNQDITKLNKRKLSYYRNTYVSFIFQDYNLISNLNLEENINLALNIQSKKKNKEQITNIINKVGLNGLEKRNVNNLSGGEKQRVAIARALVKNSKLILADEPTGNLDLENTKYIFDLLKEISKDKLVLVVTHNLDLAKKYCDQIINLEDGKITNNKTKNDLKIDTETFSLEKSKLSFFQAIKLSLRNLKNKKLKLLTMIILTSICLTTLGLSLTLTKYDINKTHANAMLNNNVTRIEIDKQIENQSFTKASPVTTFTENEIKDLSKIIKKDFTTVSKMNEDNSYLSYEFVDELDNEIPMSYYDLEKEDTLFLKYNQSKLNELSILGSLPTNSNEILIHKVFADYIIKKGIYISEIVNKKEETIKYLPTSYEQIINDKKKIKFGTSYLIISGIINEDLTKYEPLKNISSDEMLVNPSELYKEFITKFNNQISEVIVNDTFFDTISLKKNTILSKDFYKEGITYEDKFIYPKGQTAIIDNVVKYLDGTTVKETSLLNQNEVLISSTLLDELYDNKYSNNLFERIKKETEKYNNLVKKREELIKQLESELEENNELEIEYPEEIPPIDKEQIIINYTNEFLKTKGIIGKTITLEINDLYLRTQETKNKVIGTFIIKGYAYEDINTYYSKDTILNNYMRTNHEETSIYFDETNYDNLINIFNKFPSENSKYTSKTIYSNSIIELTKVVNKVSNIFKYISIGTLIFTIILFSYFNISTVNYNKKNIGILKSLGAKNIDIYKIYYLESLLLGLLSLVLSSSLCYILVILFNNIISTKLFISIKPIIFNISIIPTLFIIILVLTIISFIIPLVKITNDNPIKTIKND